MNDNKNLNPLWAKLHKKSDFEMKMSLKDFCLEYYGNWSPEGIKHWENQLKRWENQLNREYTKATPSKD